MREIDDFTMSTGSNDINLSFYGKNRFPCLYSTHIIKNHFSTFGSSLKSFIFLLYLFPKKNWNNFKHSIKTKKKRERKRKTKSIIINYLRTFSFTAVEEIIISFYFISLFFFLFISFIF